MNAKYLKGNDNNKLFSVISIIPFFLIVANLIILNHYIPNGYNFSIYEQIPTIFWLNIVTIFFIGCFLCYFGSKKFIHISIIILLLNFILILLLPKSLGYFQMDRMDSLDNFGEIFYIANTGSISNNNIYPLPLIFYSFSIILFNIPSNNFLYFYFLPLCFVGGMFIFTKRFFEQCQYLTVLTLPLLFLLYFRSYYFSFTPHYFGFIILPFFLWILLKLKNDKITKSFLIILTIFALCVPFIHPFDWIFIVFVLFSIVLIIYFNKKISPFMQWKSNNSLNKLNNFFIPILLLLVVIMFFWISYNYGFFPGVNYIDDIFSEQTTSPVLFEEGVKDFASGYNKLATMDLLFFLLLIYGRYIIPIGLIIFSIIIFLYNREKNKNSFYTLFTYLIISFFIFGLIDFILLFNPLVVHVFERMTTLNFFTLMMIPLTTLSLLIVSKFLFKNLLLQKMFSIMIVVMIFSLSLFGFSNSPSNFRPNIGAVENEFSGMKWILINKDSTKIIDSSKIHNVYVYNLFLSKYSTNFKFDSPKYDIIPHHFLLNQNNFNEYCGLYMSVMTYSIEGYILSTKKIVGPKDFYPQDRDGLTGNKLFNKIYDSLNIDIYKISSCYLN